MLPLVPFIAGVLTGVAVVKLLRDRTTRDKLDRAQQRLSDGANRVVRKARAGTASGLRAVEKTASAMRERLDEGEISGGDADGSTKESRTSRPTSATARGSARATKSSRTTTRQRASSRTRTTAPPRKAARTANASTTNSDAGIKTTANTENAGSTHDNPDA